MKKHYLQILKDSDARAKRSMEIQIKDPEDIWFGGFRDPRSSRPTPKYAIYRVTTMIACILNEDSSYYQDPVLYSSIQDGLTYIRHAQRENGYFDLGSLNFYSAPDTAFCIKRMIPTYSYLLKREQKPGEIVDIPFLREIFKDIMIKGTDAILTGGFHTPNHRWAICSSLLCCWRLFGKAEYKEFAEKFLIEGIDNTPDGEYAERSAGNYNRINNDAMIGIAGALEDDSYLEYVKKNLYMMLSYIEPDGTIFTNNSTRQDYGKKVFLKDYYMEYLYMGWRFDNKDFLRCANFIMDVVQRNNLSTMDCLIKFMMMPELKDFEFEESGLPTTYHYDFLDSNIIRARNGNWSYTILGRSPYFLYFRHDEISLSMKLAVPYFEHRAFIAPYVEKSEDGSYNLSQTMNGWYYLPYGEFRGTSDWWAMDCPHTRDKVPGPDLHLNINIRETENGVDVTLTTDGVSRVPLSLEIALNENIRIDSDTLSTTGTNQGGLLLKKGEFKASIGKNALKIGPAFGAHTMFAPQEGRTAKAFTVFMTDYTEFKRVIHIEAVPSDY